MAGAFAFPSGAASDAVAWEPALVAAWQRDGWRAADADQAMAWMIVAARAVERGELPSWEHAVRAHAQAFLFDAAAHALQAGRAQALESVDQGAQGVLHGNGWWGQGRRQAPQGGTADPDCAPCPATP